MVNRQGNEVSTMDGQETARPTNIITDINTALTVMVGNAQLLERRIARGAPVSPDYLLSVLAIIQRQGQEAARHVAKLNPQSEDPSRSSQER
jgi:hypothetical protein